MTWFEEAKFGMFIHWGAYSVAARGEWVFNREMISKEEYIEKYVNNFKAENYNPAKWMEIAKKAGIKYVVLTTKHHDGFALWDTATTEFNATKMGPEMDLVKEYVEAARKEGLKVGFYYSPADWNHPDYPYAYCRDWPTEWRDEAARQRFVKYYFEQLTELCTNYGKIDLLWYDGCIPEPLDGEMVNKKLKEIQPDMLISNRNGEPFDFKVSEQAIVPPNDDIPWEACMTLNGNWGYHSGDFEYKSAKDVIMLLLTAAKDGGNLLLNVGPKSDGEIPSESVKILQEVGRWMDKNGEAIYGVERSLLNWALSSILTVKMNKVYINLHCHLKEYWLAEFKNKIKSVYVLATNQELEFEQHDNGRLLIKNIPEFSQDELVFSIVCETEGKPIPIREKETFWIPG